MQGCGFNLWSRNYDSTWVQHGQKQTKKNISNKTLTVVYTQAGHFLLLGWTPTGVQSPALPIVGCLILHCLCLNSALMLRKPLSCMNNRCGYVPINIHLWTLKITFHMTFMGLKIATSNLVSVLGCFPNSMSNLNNFYKADIITPIFHKQKLMF